MIKGKMSLHVNIPVDLFVVLKELSDETGLTSTAIITQYLQFLQAQSPEKRQALNDKTTTTKFKLDKAKPR